MKTINQQKFIDVCQNAETAADAARQLNMHFNTFKRYAQKFGCYKTNQSHKGMKLGVYKDRIATKEILAGKYPDYQTYKLKKRLINEGIKKDACEVCG